jgi:hypothetical protein
MNIITIDLSFIFWVTFILVIWFESDIVQTVANIFKLNNILKTDEFLKYKLEVDVMSTYPEFLYITRPGYITKLLSCPICLCFWSTLISVGLLTLINPICLVLFPINYIFSLTFYLIVRKLL